MQLTTSLFFTRIVNVSSVGSLKEINLDILENSQKRNYQELLPTCFEPQYNIISNTLPL